MIAYYRERPSYHGRRDRSDGGGVRQGPPATGRRASALHSPAPYLGHGADHGHRSNADGDGRRYVQEAWSETDARHAQRVSTIDSV